MAGFLKTETVKKIRKKRKGMHSKTKISRSKSSKLYKKAYSGQGK